MPIKACTKNCMICAMYGTEWTVEEVSESGKGNVDADKDYPFWVAQAAQQKQNI